MILLPLSTHTLHTPTPILSLLSEHPRSSERCAGRGCHFVEWPGDSIPQVSACSREQGNDFPVWCTRWTQLRNSQLEVEWEKAAPSRDQQLVTLDQQHHLLATRCHIPLLLGPGHVGASLPRSQVSLSSEEAVPFLSWHTNQETLLPRV